MESSAAPACPAALKPLPKDMRAHTSRVVVKAMGVVALMLPASRAEAGRQAGRREKGEGQGKLHEVKRFSIAAQALPAGTTHPLTSGHAAHPAAAQVPGHVACPRPCCRQRVSCAAAEGVERVPAAAAKGITPAAAAATGKGVTPAATAANKGVPGKGVCLLQAPAAEEVVEGAKAVQLLQREVARESVCGCVG